MSKPTIKARLDHLEATAGNPDHDYSMTIKWGAKDDISAIYYRDGIEIPRSVYFKEAPRDQPLTINWTEYKPPTEAQNENDHNQD